MSNKSKILNKKNVYVSIIVPIYNVDNHYLKQCIDSLINQTLKAIQIILVDDGSPKIENGNLCDFYAKKDERIIVIHKENGGLCSARNTGFKMATGEYFTFVDGDDWLSNDMCEIMYNTAKKYNVDMVVCRSVREFKNKTSHFKYKYDVNTIYDKKQCKILQRDVLDFNANNASVTAKLINLKKIKENNLFHDEELKQGAEGIEFNIRLYEYINNVVFIENEFYHYRYNEDSITNSFNLENQYLILKCFEKIKSKINQDDFLMMNMFYYRMYFVIVTTAISGFFNPTNNDSFFKIRKDFKKYLKEKLVIETLSNKKVFYKLDNQRKIIIFFIKMHCFLPLKILGNIRRKSKQQS